MFCLLINNLLFVLLVGFCVGIGSINAGLKVCFQLVWRISFGTTCFVSRVLNSKLSKLESSVIVMTDGKRGAWAYNKGKIFHAEGLTVSAVDSTGAGDSFCSGFLSAYLKKKKISECLKWGIANSSNEVQYYGSIDGLLTEEKILKLKNKVKVFEI